jgi:hypothetical protein
MPVGSGRRTATGGRSVPGEQRGYAMNFFLVRTKNAPARDAPDHTERPGARLTIGASRVGSERVRRRPHHRA